MAASIPGDGNDSDGWLSIGAHPSNGLSECHCVRACAGVVSIPGSESRHPETHEKGRDLGQRAVSARVAIRLEGSAD